MYRSVALLAQQRKIDPHDEAALKILCTDLSIEFIHGDGSERIVANGVDVSAAIRTPEISILTAQVAACPTVFPSADIKFFLSATAEERGRRRYEELLIKGIDVDLQQTIAEVAARDAADTARTLAPLMQADDALVVDSTLLSINDVLEKMLAIVKDKETELAGKKRITA